MGETAAIIAAVAATAAAAAGTVSAVGGAQAAQRAGRLQMEQAQIQAQAYADQREQVAQQAQREETDRLTQLRRTLGAIDALRAGRGLAGDSMGAGVIADRSIAEAERDLDTLKLNSERESRAIGLAGDRALLSGEVAQTEAGSRALAGYAQAVESGARTLNLGHKTYRYLS